MDSKIAPADDNNVNTAITATNKNSTRICYLFVISNTMIFNQFGYELIDVVSQFNVVSVVDWNTTDWCVSWYTRHFSVVRWFLEETTMEGLQTIITLNKLWHDNENWLKLYRYSMLHPFLARSQPIVVFNSMHSTLRLSSKFLRESSQKVYKHLKHSIYSGIIMRKQSHHQGLRNNVRWMLSNNHSNRCVYCWLEHRLWLHVQCVQGHHSVVTWILGGNIITEHLQTNKFCGMIMEKDKS